MRHRHADLIHAWAEGAAIQFSNKYSEWTDCPCNEPQWSEDIEYRIKPTPKPDEIGYVGFACAADGSWYLTDAYEESRCVPRTTEGEKVSAILKLTQCGETGKLKSAEVLNANP